MQEIFGIIDGLIVYIKSFQGWLCVVRCNGREYRCNPKQEPPALEEIPASLELFPVGHTLDDGHTLDLDFGVIAAAAKTENFPAAVVIGDSVFVPTKSDPWDQEAKCEPGLAKYSEPSSR